MELYFALVKPKYSGNIGSVARVLKNFGFKNLILINPTAKIDYYADLSAAHAKDVLHKAKIYKTIEEFINEEKIKYLIGTTARLGGEKNPRRTVVPTHFIRNLELPDSKIGILFGNEESGLSNDELANCDIVFTIPASEEYPVLNLSHAVAILAYEFSILMRNYRDIKHRPSTFEEREILLNNLFKIIDTIIPVENKKPIYKGIVRNMVNRAFLTGREVHSLIGIFKRILRCLEEFCSVNESS